MRNEDDLIGTVIDGRYRILRRLGAGGMGEVYLGEHLLLKRQEALKVLKRRLARDEGHLARFRREARATNRVQHPNIVSFYDFGKLPDGRLYLSMEFADGPNLKECLEQEGRFEVPRAVAILRQLALAIEYAHSKNVIHRDLKPQNLVLVQEPGHPDTLKVLDFGVAKITAPGYMEQMAITREGEIFGTPAYISPEQIRGVSDDPRIDVYALGCIGYELLTGEPPFVGRPMSVLEAHVSDVPESPSHRCMEAQIPAELDEIILDCLIKERDLRIQTAGHVAELLASLRLAPAGHVPRGISQGALSGFESEATLEGIPEAALEDRDAAVTTDVHAIHGSVVLRKILRSLGESMCDLGCSDPKLLVLLAEVSQVEEELKEIREELHDLVRSDELVTLKARERTASLRFALGELRFGRSDEDESVAQGIEVLTKRLADAEEQTRIQHATITERQITQTAERAHKYEELGALDHRLNLLIDTHAEEMSKHEVIAELLENRARVLKRIKLGKKLGKKGLGDTAPLTPISPIGS
jgi:tRNA A-37 threonylcarbamoyl transferase component Bud32